MFSKVSLFTVMNKFNNVVVNVLFSKFFSISFAFQRGKVN